MEKFIGQGLNPIQKADLLQTNCSAVELHGYTHKFSQEEISAMKDTLAEDAIALSRISQEKADMKEKFKAKEKPYSERYSKHLKFIRDKAEYREDSLFKFVYEEEGMVGYYNSNGELVDERRARPEELQGNIFKPVVKTGTNN